MFTKIRHKLGLPDQQSEAVPQPAARAVPSTEVVGDDDVAGDDDDDEEEEEEEDDDDDDDSTTTPVSTGRANTNVARALGNYWARVPTSLHNWHLRIAAKQRVAPTGSSDSGRQQAQGSGAKPKTD